MIDPTGHPADRDLELLRSGAAKFNLINKSRRFVLEISPGSARSRRTASFARLRTGCGFNQVHGCAGPDYKKKWFGSANFRWRYLRQLVEKTSAGSCSVAMPALP